MLEHASSLEQRFEDLTEEVGRLRDRVDTLAQQVESLARLEPQADGSAAALPGTAFDAAVAAVSEKEEGAVNTATVLSGVAAFCFVLVIALVLRMLADHAIVARELGVLLGIVYAATLMGFGIYRHAHSRHLLPVYALSGVLLLDSIVYEATMSFQVLSIPVAHILLFAGMAVMTFMALRFQRALPLYVGVLGASGTAFSLEFPYPIYPWLGGFLLISNLAAYSGIRVPRGRGVIAPSVLLSLLFWGLWVIRLRTPASRGLELGEELAIPWFIPLLALFATTYVILAVWSASHLRWHSPTLEGVLPVLNVAWAYPAAYAAVEAWGGREERVAAAGGAIAVIHLLMALFMAKRKGRERPPTTTFTPAAFFLLAIALPGATENMLVTLLLWGLVATGIAVLSFIRQNRLARGIAYLFQAFACAMALETGAFTFEAPLPAFKTGIAALLFALCLAHYAWCRRRAAQPETPFFKFAAVLLLVTGLIYAYVLASLVLFAMQQQLNPDSAALFQCGRSLLIATGAIGLLTLALRWRNGEVLCAGFLAALFGATKVFGYDLTHLEDIALLLSLSAFGVTAAASSLAWRRWQQAGSGGPDGNGRHTQSEPVSV